MSRFFLGYPPAYIKRWIKEHASLETPDPIGSDDWSQLALAMESGCSDSEPVSFRGKTLTPGEIVTVVYYPDETDTSTSWSLSCQVLGYNGSIPQYVKYRRAVPGGHIYRWIASVKDGSVAEIAVGDKVHTRTYDASTHQMSYAEAEDITAVGEMNKVYGNLNTYACPETITVGENVYDFAGYNITLMSQYGLFQHVFDSDNNNSWKESTLQEKLNGTSFISRFNGENGFLKNICNTVTRTWKYSSGTTSPAADMTIDKFLVLGSGNINCKGNQESSQRYYDNMFDTSRFIYVFPWEAPAFTTDGLSQWKRNIISTDGKSCTECNWWLRSAYADDPGLFGNTVNAGVTIDGKVGFGFANGEFAVLPVCLIG